MAEKDYDIRDIANAICNKIGEHQRDAVKSALDEHFKGWFFTMWHWDDIKARANDRDEDEVWYFDDDILTDEQCQKIEDLILKTHDANIGINWDVIDVALSEIVK